jgi:type I restriction enzyme R subunit
VEAQRGSPNAGRSTPSPARRHARPHRLLDLLEHFIVFDASKAGAVRKVVARNHQVLGVNRAVAAVARQEALKAQFPPGERMRHRVVKLALAEPLPLAN